jgi:hypothetical protein
MATAMPIPAPIYCQRHFSSGPLLINIHTRVTRTPTFIITILFSFLFPHTVAPSWSPSCANNLSLASPQYSLLRRSDRKHLRFLDIHHHRGLQMIIKRTLSRETPSRGETVHVNPNADGQGEMSKIGRYVKGPTHA